MCHKRRARVRVIVRVVYNIVHIPHTSHTPQTACTLHIVFPLLTLHPPFTLHTLLTFHTHLTLHTLTHLAHTSHTSHTPHIPYTSHTPHTEYMYSLHCMHSSHSTHPSNSTYSSHSFHPLHSLRMHVHKLGFRQTLNRGLTLWMRLSIIKASQRLLYMRKKSEFVTNNCITTLLYLLYMHACFYINIVLYTYCNDFAS